MKLRSIYVTCRDNYEAIKNLSSRAVTLNGRTGRRVEGWNAARDALIQVQNIHALKEKVESVINAVPSFFMMKDSFDLDSSEWNQLSSCVHTLLF